MNKALKGPPAAVPVATPYGLKPLVLATERLAEAHVLSDVTELTSVFVLHLNPEVGFHDLMLHTGWVDPAGRIGLLDYSYHFPEDEDQGLHGTRIHLVVYPVTGGNGVPLHCDYATPVASLWMRLESELWGELNCTHCSGVTPAWAEWAKEAGNTFKAHWKVELDAGRLARLSSKLARGDALAGTLRELWSVEATADAAQNLGLDLVLIDDEEEADQHCSTLEHTSQQILLVTPWLAAELQKRGAMAKVVHGLPLWSRDNKDAPSLEHVLQDITYEKFGQSEMTELAATHEE